MEQKTSLAKGEEAQKALNRIQAVLLCAVAEIERVIATDCSEKGLPIVRRLLEEYLQASDQYKQLEQQCDQLLKMLAKRVDAAYTSS